MCANKELDYWSVVVFLFRHACLRIKGMGFVYVKGQLTHGVLMIQLVQGTHEGMCTRMCGCV